MCVLGESEKEREKGERKSRKGTEGNQTKPALDGGRSRGGGGGERRAAAHQ